MRYEYSSGWHRHFKEPVEPLTEEDARQRHSTGQGYCVTARSKGGVRLAFIEVSADYFAVNFLDQRGRVFLTYGFEQMEAERLFLKQAIYSAFDGETDQPSKKTSYYFAETGAVTIERVAGGPGPAEASEGRWDVSGNWESRPTFGNYEALLRQQRVRSGHLSV